MDVLPSDNEAERLADLRAHRVLDTPPEEEFDGLVRLAALVCGVPIAAVSLIDEHRQWFKAVTGLTVTETPRDIAFCAHTIRQPDLMVVPDTLADPRFADNPLVTAARTSASTRVPRWSPGTDTPSARCASSTRCFSRQRL